MCVLNSDCAGMSCTAGLCDAGPVTFAVSGTFDVDRCDYLLRDSHMTGVRYGTLDLDWLLQSLRLHCAAEGE